MTGSSGTPKSKTVATWLALLGGSLGLHRFYLHGWRDLVGWSHPLPTLVGLYGIQRALAFGQDDGLSWALIPLLGITLAASMLAAIVYGLTSNEKWNARFNPFSPDAASGWLAIFGVVLALFFGTTVLMATIAFSGQRFFEYQIEAARASRS